MVDSIPQALHIAPPNVKHLKGLVSKCGTYFTLHPDTLPIKLHPLLRIIDYIFLTESHT